MVSFPQNEFLKNLYKELSKINKKKGGYIDLSKDKNAIDFKRDYIHYTLSEYNYGIAFELNIHSKKGINKNNSANIGNILLSRIEQYLVTSKIYDSEFFKKRVQNIGKKTKTNLEEIIHNFKEPEINAKNRILFPLEKRKQYNKKEIKAFIEYSITPIHFLSNDYFFNDLSKKSQSQKNPYQKDSF